jgi:NADH-quinone oxidoreductase E subunit
MASQIETRNSKPETAVLTDGMKEAIRALFPKYETKRACLLPALHIVQEAHNHVSDRAVREIAELLELTPAAVLDTLTFYGWFRRHPRGRYVLTVCRSIACQITGYPSIYRHLKQKLGISDHQTTADGKFSLHLDECLALCDMAPCMQVNGKCHGPLTPAKVDEILKECT